MTIASKILSPEKVQALSQAFEVTNNIVSMASNPQEALQKAGVTKQDLTKIKGYLNNPMAGFLLKPLGVDVEQAKQIIANIETMGYQKVNSPTVTAQDDELKDLQDNLARLK